MLSDLEKLQVARMIEAAYKEGRDDGYSACHPENEEPEEYCWENSAAKLVADGFKPMDLMEKKNT